MSWNGSSLQSNGIRYCDAGDVRNILAEKYTELNLTEENLTMAIDMASREIELTTGTVYYSKEIEEEMEVSNGYVRVKIPLIEVVELCYWSEGWNIMNQGIDDDYYIDSKKLGKVKINTNVGSRVKIKYKYGYEVVPGMIRMIVALMSARNAIITKLNNSESEITTKNYQIVLGNLEEKSKMHIKNLKIKRYGTGYL